VSALIGRRWPGGPAAAETGADPGDVEPWTAARALIGLHQAAVEYSRRQILAGTRNPTLARRVRRQIDRGIERLSAGLAGYGVVPEP
jgi:hypothetical protein